MKYFADLPCEMQVNGGSAMDEYYEKLVMSELTVEEFLNERNNFYLVDDEIEEYLIRKEDVAKIIAIIPSSQRAKFYDSEKPLNGEIITTCGNLLDRISSVQLRNSFIDELTSYQMNYDSMCQLKIKVYDPELWMEL